MQIAVAPWQWNTDGPDWPYWDAPEADKCIGRFELRSLPECGQYGGAGAKRGGIFTYNTAPALLNTLDTAVDIPLAKRLDLRKTWEIPGDVSLSPANPLDFIAWCKLTQGDPTAQNRWRSKRGSRRYPPKLTLAGQVIWQGKLEDVIDNTIAVFKADYARLKSEGTPIEHLRKVTGAEMLSLWGRMGDDLLDPLLGPYASDGWSRPSTIIIDAFTDTNGTLIQNHTPTGGGFTWSLQAGGCDIQSNEANDTSAAGTHVRAELDFSTDGHYSEMDVVVGTYAGVHVRWDSTSVNTNYLWRNNSSTGDNEYYKQVTGSYTKLWNAAQTVSRPYTAKIEVTEADDHTGSIDGTAKMSSFSDNSLTGYLRTGFHLRNTNDRGDNYEAGDLGAAASVVPFRRRIEGY
jgi:hypothetical protein